MSGLFVPEEEEESQFHEELTSSQQQQLQRELEKTEAEASSDDKKNIKTDEEEYDDPVIEEIPIYLNQIASSIGKTNVAGNPDKYSTELCLLQYISQLAVKPLTNEKGIAIASSRIKPNSDMLEIDVPLDTARFYDSQRAEHWNQMATETLGGIFEDSIGNYAMLVRKKKKSDKTAAATRPEVSSDKEVVITPIDKVSQIRPIFHHIDAFDDSQKTKKELESEGKEINASGAVQVVQRTAKSTGGENEIRYSDAISSFKKFQEEDFLPAGWYDESEPPSKELKKALFGNEELFNKTLIMKELKMDYLDTLLSDRLTITD